ncbi:hypothetical protein [Desulfuromonas thiophila]|uniref:hypothetical protein n=1 Tax=Desulfuromonas thiophila TaxID=57664 RepID=UPI0024A8500D|nr:hypothetical protein [Desulfuromonas thiophila]
MKKIIALSALLLSGCASATIIPVDGGNIVQFETDDKIKGTQVIMRTAERHCALSGLKPVFTDAPIFVYDGMIPENVAAARLIPFSGPYIGTARFRCE